MRWLFIDSSLLSGVLEGDAVKDDFDDEVEMRVISFGWLFHRIELRKSVVVCEVSKAHPARWRGCRRWRRSVSFDRISESRST